jgi:hypothetical protein
MSPASPIDPRSDAIVLFYNGGPTPRDVPARDLHGGDLARIAYVRAHVGLEKGRPATATPAQLEALATQLVGLGSFLTEPISSEDAERLAAAAREADTAAWSRMHVMPVRETPVEPVKVPNA